MEDKTLYTKILELEFPWEVSKVELNLSKLEVEVSVKYNDKESVNCPECGKSSIRYDVVNRRWRHLDTCQYQTILIGEVPRVKCEDHGVLQMQVPWSEKHSRFTHCF